MFWVFVTWKTIGWFCCWLCGLKKSWLLKIYELSFCCWRDCLKYTDSGCSLKSCLSWLPAVIFLWYSFELCRFFFILSSLTSYCLSIEVLTVSIFFFFNLVGFMTTSLDLFMMFRSNFGWDNELWCDVVWSLILNCFCCSRN